MTDGSSDPSAGGLTREQINAAGARDRRIFIEAAPGSGKTTVSAQRFGVQRFTVGVDDRAVVAVSFSRSATKELRQRVRAQWGDTALTWPHRIVTLDGVLCELLEHLLRLGLLAWPGGHQTLQVLDTWKVRAGHSWSNRKPVLVVQNRQVVVRQERHKDMADRVNLPELKSAVAEGVCTHDDVRNVLGSCFADAELVDVLGDRISASVRALIVDEVFDANQLDLALVELAAKRQVEITLVGDPWQALYLFRGAGPQLVPGLIREHGFATLPLTHSFRFRTPESRELAARLRAQIGAELAPHDDQQLDVVLATRWKQLWAASKFVLPLSFGTPNGPPAAAAILLLNHLTTHILERRAIYVDEALVALGITDSAAVERLDADLARVLDILHGDGKAAIDAAWAELVAAIRTETSRQFPRRHPTHTARLSVIQDRLQAGASTFVPGMTVHQAKGCEWDYVGVTLTQDQRQVLAHGLDSSRESHRELYVALTRARCGTVAI